MQLGKYLIERQLGAGGMGVVYLGRDVLLNRAVAVKVLNQEMAENATVVETFLREAEITASISHPNIVQVYSFGQEEGLYYLALEFIDGESLQSRIKREKMLPELEVIEIGIGIARGLECAYNRGLIHRDIKPGNIVFDANNTPKIVDFGISRPMSTIDHSSEIWGSPYYMAPEKLEGKQEDFRSDLYSLGVALYQAISGRLPYDADTVKELVAKHLAGKLVSLKAFLPSINDSTANAIKKAMARRRSDRHSSYDEFIRELEDAKRRLLKSNEAVPEVRDDQAQLHDTYMSWVIYLGIALAILVPTAAAYTAYRIFHDSAQVEGYQPKEDSKSKLVIISATYGTGTRLKDVTQILRQRVKSGRLLFQANDDFFEDTTSYAGKFVHIKYSIDDTTKNVFFPEGAIVVIPSDSH